MAPAGASDDVPHGQGVKPGGGQRAGWGQMACPQLLPTPKPHVHTHTSPATLVTQMPVCQRPIPHTPSSQTPLQATAPKQPHSTPHIRAAPMLPRANKPPAVLESGTVGAEPPRRGQGPPGHRRRLLDWMASPCSPSNPTEVAPLTA